MLNYYETLSWTKPEDWLEYIENCKGLTNRLIELQNYCKYVKSMEKIRELTNSEKAFLKAYENNSRC